MAGRPWTDEDTTTVRRLHAEGRSLHSIAKEMGRSKGMVGRWSEKAGLTWERTQTAAAAAAKATDNKARRTSIVGRIYTEAEDVLATVEAGRAGRGWNTILKGSFGVEEAKSLAFVPSRDRRDVADTLSRLLMSAGKLEAVDASNGVERERSLLGELGKALGVTGPET